MKLPIKASGSEIGLAVRMTPLIDVIFLLLIFFMLAIRFEKPEGVLENMLPQNNAQGSAEKQEEYEEVKVRIKLIQKGKHLKIFLQERELSTYAELLSYLHMLPENIMIVLEPGLTVPYKYVIGVYNTCLKAKQQNIVFALSPP